MRDAIVLYHMYSHLPNKREGTNTREGWQNMNVEGKNPPMLLCLIDVEAQRLHNEGRWTNNLKIINVDPRVPCLLGRKEYLGDVSKTIKSETFGILHSFFNLEKNNSAKISKLINAILNVQNNSYYTYFGIKPPAPFASKSYLSILNPNPTRQGQICPYLYVT